MEIITVPTTRNLHSALNPAIKSLNYLNNILAKIEAINSGADFYVQKGGEPRSQFVDLGHMVRESVAKRRSARSLKESEESYRILFEGIQEGMAYCQMLYEDHGEPIDWLYIKVNAQFTVLAPSGTFAFSMDCLSTCFDPEMALVN